jgi:putative hydrolase of the HAD superfamily
MTVVFDVAGVLVDWHPVRLLQRLLPQHAPDEASARRRVEDIFTGYGGDWGEFDRGTVTPEALVPRLATRTGIPTGDLGALVERIPHEFDAIADTVALLAELREAGADLCFLSNMPSPYADRLEARHGFFAWFRAGVWSGRVGAIKPEPEIFAIAAERFGVPPDELMFFDDHAPNVDAARQAGWQSRLFSGAAQARVDLQALGRLGPGRRSDPR